MRIHSLLHAKHETIAAVANWSEHHSHSLSATNLYLGDELPCIDDFDLLLIMGGPMSVNDENKYKWLASEKLFIKDAIDKGKYVLGICLGAQLIANALGAEVKANPYKEIGWFPVKKAMWSANPIADILPFFFTTFHWHGETFDIPENAKLIFSSEACPNQSFIYGDRTVAFQFHMEVTPEIIQGFIEYGKNELKKDKYVQSADEILSMISLTNENNLYLFRILDYFHFMFNKQR